MANLSPREKVDIANQKIQADHDRKPYTCLKPRGQACYYLKLRPEEVVGRDFLNDAKDNGNIKDSENDDKSDDESDNESVMDSCWTPLDSYLLDPSSYTWSEVTAPILTYKQSCAAEGVTLSAADITMAEAESFYTHVWPNLDQ